MNCPHCNVSFFEEWSSPEPLVWDENCRAQGIKHAECPSCARLIVKLVEGKVDLVTQSFEVVSDGDEEFENEILIYPSSKDTDLPDEVPGSYRSDYFEARSVLEISPKASAAISRRLLQNLLEDEMNLKGKNLSRQIEAFLELDNVPSHLSNSIDAVRNIGNFAAHPSKETNTGEVVDVEPGEADWLIEVLLSLFDFIFIQPKRIEKRRKELNEKLEKFGKPEMKGPTS